MANAGILGSCITAAANTWQTVYTVPSTGVKFTHGTIHAYNPNTAAVTFGLAGTFGATPSTFLEGMSAVPVNGGVYTRSCLTFSPNEKIMVRSSQAGVHFEFRGIEQESAAA